MVDPLPGEEDALAVDAAVAEAVGAALAEAVGGLVDPVALEAGLDPGGAATGVPQLATIPPTSSPEITRSPFAVTRARLSMKQPSLRASLPLTPLLDLWRTARRDLRRARESTHQFHQRLDLHPARSRPRHALAGIEGLQLQGGGNDRLHVLETYQAGELSG